MNIRRKNHTFVILAATLWLSAVCSQAQTIPQVINYQGRLTDNLGNSVSNGYYEIEFRIWDDGTLAGAGNLVWGRSFPLHVVEGGLFNVLLSNDGGAISTPGEPLVNELKDAFGGDDRFLGLTIVVSNGVPISAGEISPRQQLASAPYALQAETANTVRNQGVLTATIANSAVTTEKIADGSVINSKLANSAVGTAKLADGSVTTPKIADGAVTAAKLNINGDVELHEHSLFLRGNDTNHVLKYATTFGGKVNDGPVLLGYSGGVLGTSTNGVSKPALEWSNTQKVTLPGEVRAEGKMDVFGSLVDLSQYVVRENNPAAPFNTPRFTANADGFVLYYLRRGSTRFQVWQNGTSELFTHTGTTGVDSGALLESDVNGTDGHSHMWPIKRGDDFQLKIRDVSSADQFWPASALYFMPLGASQGASSITIPSN